MQVIEEIFEMCGNIKLSEESARIWENLEEQIEPRVVKYLKRFLFQKQKLILSQFWFKHVDSTNALKEQKQELQDEVDLLREKLHGYMERAQEDRTLVTSKH